MATLPVVIDPSGSARGAAEARKHIETVKNSAASLTRGLVALAGGFSAVFAIREGIQRMAEFEAVMRMVKTVSGATDIQFRQLEQSARKLGATTRFSASEAAEGQLALVKAGLSAEQTMAALPDVLNLAAAGNISLGIAADTAANALAQFKLPAEQAQRVTDAFVATANASTVEVLEVAESFKYAGSIMASVQKPIEEVAAAVGLLGQFSIKGSSAGTNLRGILGALLDPTEEAKAALKGMHVELEQVDLASKSLADVLQVLHDRGMTVAQAIQIFSKLNATAASILVDNVDALREFEGKIKDFAGKSAELAAASADTLKGRFKSLGSTIEELTLKGGDAGLVGWLKKGTSAFTEFIRVASGAGDPTSQVGKDAHELSEIFSMILGSVLAIKAVNLAKWLIDVSKAMVVAVGATSALSKGLVGLATFGAGVAGALFAANELDKLYASMESESRKNSLTAVTDSINLAKAGVEAAKTSNIDLDALPTLPKDQQAAQYRELLRQDSMRLAGYRELLGTVTTSGDPAVLDKIRTEIGPLAAYEQGGEGVGAENYKATNEEIIGFLSQQISALSESTSTWSRLSTTAAGAANEAERKARAVEDANAALEQQKQLAGFIADMEFEKTTVGMTERELNNAMANRRGQQLGATPAELERIRELSNEIQDLRKLESIAYGIGDAFARSFEDAVFEAKSLREVVNALADDILRLLFREVIAKPAAQAIGSSLYQGLSGLLGGIGGGPASGTEGSAMGNIITFGKGGVPELFDRPTAFQMGGGRIGVAGERGAEVGIAPLVRGPDGVLGVRQYEGGAGGRSGKRPMVVNFRFNVYGAGGMSGDSLSRTRRQAKRELRDLLGDD